MLVSAMPVFRLRSVAGTAAVTHFPTVSTFFPTQMVKNVSGQPFHSTKEYLAATVQVLTPTQQPSSSAVR